MTEPRNSAAGRREGDQPADGPDQAHRIGLVAEFLKSASGVFTLFAIITLEEKKGHGGRTYIARTEYDVDHSKKYGHIFHEAGFGGGAKPIEVSGIYFSSGIAEVKEGPTNLVDAADRPPWKSRKTKAIRQRNRTRRLRQLPKAFTPEKGEDILDWLERNGIEGKSVYCETCRDCFPENSLCEHCWWCDAQGWWSTPGERCECAPNKGCNEP